MSGDIEMQPAIKKRLDELGSVVQELTIVVPALLLLTFGTLDMGFRFWSAHIVQEAARSTARFASVTYTNLDPTTTQGQAAIAEIEQQARDRLLGVDEMFLNDVSVEVTPPYDPPGDGINDFVVSVKINADYDFLLLKMIGLFESPVDSESTVRYELQSISLP